jgi:hypothetical protein
MSNAATQAFDWRKADEQKAKVNTAIRRKEFAKKATDQKVHENLLQSIEIYLGNPNPAALSELRSAIKLSTRNLKP